MPDKKTESEFRRFLDLAKRVLAVDKPEIDRRAKEHKEAQAAKKDDKKPE